MDRLGDLIIVDDEDERLVLGATGKFRAEVLPEDSAGEWRELKATDELVEFYDPTDIFGDLADALAEAFPSIAPDEDGTPAAADEAEAGAAAEGADEAEAAEGDAERPTAPTPADGDGRA